MSRFVWAGTVLVVLLGVFQFEHRQSVDNSPTYKALCHAPPLHGEAIYKAARETRHTIVSASRSPSTVPFRLWRCTP
jgi:hypothetical protein